MTVTYELTALSDAGEQQLREFADGYPEFLRGWQDTIAAALATPSAGSASAAGDGPTGGSRRGYPA